MFLVIDANELFALLIKGSYNAEKIFFSDQIQLIAPEFLLEEFDNNKQEILEKTHKSKEEFARLLEVIKRRIQIIPQEESTSFTHEAQAMFPHHTKDTPYLALALKYNCPIWSEEKLLKKQQKIEVYNTLELRAIVGNYNPP